MKLQERFQERKKEQKGGRRKRGKTVEEMGCGSFSVHHQLPRLLWQRKKKRGQTVPAWSFCTSAQNAGEMMGLNKSASENRKEIFPIVLPVWRMNRWKHWPPCLSQCGQETDCHSCSYDWCCSHWWHISSHSLWSAERLSCPVVCWVIALAQDLFAGARGLAFNRHPLDSLCDILSWKNREPATKNDC